MRRPLIRALLLAIIAQTLVEASLDKPVLINLNHNLRVKASPNEFLSFKINKSELKPNQQYNILLSWIGSVGVQMRIYWKSDKEDEISKSLFKPLDTEKLHFSTDAQGNIEGASPQSRIGESDEFQFTIVGYRNTRARDLEAKNQSFEYFIKYEEVIADGAPLYVLKQVGLIVILTLVFVIIISKSYFSKSGYLYQLFSNPVDDKKNE